MSTVRVEIEEIQTTKSEKLLAVVLAVFMLIGGIWAYQKIDDYVADALAPTSFVLTPSEQTAVNRLGSAQNQLEAANGALERSRADLELRREAYNTALNAGQPAVKLERAYNQAEAAFEDAKRAKAAAAAAVTAARPDANAAIRHQSRLERDRFDRHELVAFLARLGFALTALVVGYWLLARLRRRGSRYLPVAFASVAVATLLALVLAGDYVTDYVDPLDFGPPILSLAGIGLTLGAFVALQRYLAKRIPVRRVRKRGCPFCGYPVKAGEHCEGCGRSVVGECAACHSPRRVGTLHCAACGNK